MFKYGPSQVFGGWTLSSNLFLRSGLPFTLEDLSASGILEGYNYGSNPGGGIFASPVGYVPGSCTSAVNSPCLKHLAICTERCGEMEEFRQDSVPPRVIRSMVRISLTWTSRS